MLSNAVLIGSFVPKNNILSFIEKIKNNLKIGFDKIFVYSIESNNNEYLVTFKSKNKNAIKDFNNSTILHVKNSCLFSINALNKLIETINDNKEVDNKDFKMNWDDYKDKLIILSSNELNIHNINKIEDKCVFFT